MQNNEAELKKAAAALRRLEILERREAFDPTRTGSKPTSAQQEVIDEFGRVHHQYIRAGNQSGKSQTCARLLTWAITGSHPTWTKPPQWEGPLLAIVAARTGKQLENSLIPRIRSYLPAGTYKVVKAGNATDRIELDDGSRIVFQSLENHNQARERLQSYTAHIAWIDELPPTVGILSELLRSIQANDGYLLASFTPISRNLEVQRFIDGVLPPKAKVYRFQMLDNPVYADPRRRQEVLDTLLSLPEAVRNSRLYGDWVQEEDQVYYFDYESMVKFPEGYSHLWRHVEVVDPALSSALGLTVWAEDPQTNHWYCVLAEYIKGIHVPTLIIEEVRKRTAHYNIVRRISDPHEVWYIQQAGAPPYNLRYQGVYKKHERKGELIKGFQEKLGQRLFLAPVAAQALIDEILECRWADRGDGRIVNASSYHLLDTAQYFADGIPAAEKRILAATHDDWLLKANEIRKHKVEQRTKALIRRRRW